MRKKIANEIEIIHEDDSLLVLNKPSGLIVNRSKTAREKTLQDYLDEYLNLPQLVKTGKLPRNRRYLNNAPD